jgi:hypothetical protein
MKNNLKNKLIDSVAMVVILALVGWLVFSALVAMSYEVLAGPPTYVIRNGLGYTIIQGSEVTQCISGVNGNLTCF